MSVCGLGGYVPKALNTVLIKSVIIIKTIKYLSTQNTPIYIGYYEANYFFKWQNRNAPENIIGRL